MSQVSLPGVVPRRRRGQYGSTVSFDEALSVFGSDLPSRMCKGDVGQSRVVATLLAHLLRTKLPSGYVVEWRPRRSHAQTIAVSTSSAKWDVGFAVEFGEIFVDVRLGAPDAVLNVLAEALFCQSYEVGVLSGCGKVVVHRWEDIPVVWWVKQTVYAESPWLEVIDG